MRLDRFRTGGFNRGASRLSESLWVITSGFIFETWIPGSWWRAIILRSFGAEIGRAVVIKPHVRIKFPWRLTVSDFCWIGQGVWIDNLCSVKIYENACVSQGTYIGTGNHDWTKETFDLLVQPVTVGAHAWLGARSIVAPGVNVGNGAVLTMGSLAVKNLSQWSVYTGAPAKKIKERVLRDG